MCARNEIGTITINESCIKYACYINIPVLTFTVHVTMRAKTLNIIHFNDVYNVDECKQSPKGGAARFTTALKKHGAGKQSIVLFSGDCLNPSIISTATQGRHMPEILNKMCVRCAVVGNHDFDFGMDTLTECMELCEFPWINSNVYDAEEDCLIPPKNPYTIIEHEGVRIGLIGLMEVEWVETISCFSSSAITVADFCEVGSQLAKMLKNPQLEYKCDLVIALTHMRWPNDRILAANVPQIDLILGGHDHDYETEWVESNFDNPSSKEGRTKRLIVKSGSDYRTFSHIYLNFDMNTRQVINIEVEKVVMDDRWEPDAEVSVIKIRKFHPMFRSFMTECNSEPILKHIFN